MSDLLLTLPILIPFIVAVVTIFTARWSLTTRIIGLTGSAALFAASILLFVEVWTHGILTVQMSGWPAPFGITFVADTLSAIMVVMAGTMGFATALYSLFSVDAESNRLGYTPMLHVLLAGVSGAFLTGDIFNLYVWFEILLIASFVLLVLGGTKGQFESAVKYVLLNLLASMLFLTGVGMLYGLTGTLNMADLAVKLQDVEQTGAVVATAMLFLVAFGVKAAVFPLFFWLPASYHTPHFGVSAVFAGLLTKVGVYALFRVFTLIFTQDIGYTHTVLMVIGGLTMVTGVLGALAQMEFRRLLSFHIISQIGYMIMGLALYTPLAIAGGVFFIAHNIIAKSNLFLVGGVAHRILGTGELPKMGGLWRSYPFLGVLFLLSALSLAGMPPFSGFWGKVVLIKAGLDAQAWIIATVALVVGFFTLFSMTKLWLETFWKKQPNPIKPDPDDPIVNPESVDGKPRKPVLTTMMIPIVGLALATLAMGLAFGPLLDVSLRAAEELLDPTAYIEAVLEAGA